MLYDNKGNTLFQGVSSFTVQPVPASDSRALRIMVPVAIEGNYVQAVLDTGGMYFMCDSDLVSLSGDDLSDWEGEDVVRVRGHTIAGSLYRLKLQLLATEGNSVEVEVTAFVPNAPHEWPLPPYMGFQGCLERFRFAIDGEADLFYFGGGPY